MIDLIMLGRICTKFLREMFQRVHARTPAAGSIIFQCAARYAEFLGAVGIRLTRQFLICTNDICYIIANSQINSLLSNSHIKNIQEIARNSELNNSLDRPSLQPKHDVLRLRHCGINAFQYRKSAGDVMNYTLSPKLLGHKTKDRPGVVDPLKYFLLDVLEFLF